MTMTPDTLLNAHIAHYQAALLKPQSDLSRAKVQAGLNTLLHHQSLREQQP